MKGIGFSGGYANARTLSILMLTLMKGQLIESNTLKETFKPQSYGRGKISKQTLGWWHGKVNGYQSYFHPGGGGGYSCEVQIYPDTGLVRVMIMNKTQTFGDLKLFKTIDKLWLPNI